VGEDASMFVKGSMKYLKGGGKFCILILLMSVFQLKYCKVFLAVKTG
jgi:hypothetical protein